MKEPKNLELESSLNPEPGEESEPLNLLPLGMILTLISGLGGIVVMALPSKPINPESSALSSKLEWFSPPISTSQSLPPLNPISQPISEDLPADMMGNLIPAPHVQSNPSLPLLEELSLEQYSSIPPNLLDENINILNPSPQALTEDNNVSKVETTIESIENTMTPLNLTASRPQYQMLTQQPSNLQPTSPLPVVSEQDGVELTLQDVIILALENNRTIKNQYLERIVERQNLAVAEDKFNPDFTPSLSIGWDNITQGNLTTMTRGLILSAKVFVRIPTGGALNLEWTGQRQQRNYQGSGFSDQDVLRQNLAVVFNQPLLRGAGETVNRASVEIARIQETINLLNLKSILIDKITETILAYRNLLQAQEQLKIEQQSLIIAQQQVENTQVFIEAGRRPRADLITVQTRVANQEISLLNAQNNLNQQRLNLLELLDIDEDVNIIASENLEIQPQTLEPSEIKQLGFENQPNYLQARLNLEIFKTQLVVAENNRRWNIDFKTEVRHEPAPDIIDNQTDLRAGLVFSKTLGDRTLERDFQRSRIDVLQAQNNLTEASQKIEIDVSQRLQDIEATWKKVELSKRATQLAEEQLRNEKDKVELGVEGSSLVDLVRFQSDLTQAQNDELNAKIEYLNALTNLYQSLGITLDKLEITLENKPLQNNE